MLPPLLVDCCIATQVVTWLRERGVDVVTVPELGWAHRSDDELLAEAHAMQRFVLTHDSDFGRLAIAEGQAVHGILLLRPGDRRPDEVVAELPPLLARELEWDPPMIAVYRAGRLRIRRPPR